MPVTAVCVTLLLIQTHSTGSGVNYYHVRPISNGNTRSATNGTATGTGTGFGAVCNVHRSRTPSPANLLRVQELVLVVHDATAASEVTEVHHWQPACEVPPCQCGAEESAA